jgi:hypothetical protein
MLNAHALLIGMLLHNHAALIQLVLALRARLFGIQRPQHAALAQKVSVLVILTGIP